MHSPKSLHPLAAALQFDTWPEAEQIAFLAEFGAVVSQAAIARLLVSLDEAAVAELEAYLDQVTEETDVIAHLLETYPDFERFVNEEATALREEAEKVIGT